MSGKQAKTGKIVESCYEFLIGGSKVAIDLRFEARRLLAKLPRFSKIRGLGGRKWSCL